ncbi:MAG TPA: hypothetical protein VL988_06725 [Solirubrobacteraceae bacterium]|nr:hypothetical protein [Solirubrobacteraceae bacterium]
MIIPTAWLAVLLLLVAACRAAAEGDGRRLAGSGARQGSIGVKLTLAPTSRPRPARARLQARHQRPLPAMRRRRAAHELHQR